jgi:hypothetical protein
MHSDVDELSLGEALDGLVVFVTGPVLGATLCPGITLCVPGLALFGAAIALPLVVLGMLALLVAALVAIPFAVARGAVRLVRNR